MRIAGNRARRATKYKLTGGDRAQLGPWHEKWLPLATNCNGMTDEDRAVTRAAIRSLYEVVNLPPPPDRRIVFVASPLAAVLAGGFASAIWYVREDPARLDTIRAAPAETAKAALKFATRAATPAATQLAMRRTALDATWDNIKAVTGEKTLATILSATQNATRAATRAATVEATVDATWAATEATTVDATFAATTAAMVDATWAATIAATTGEVDAETADAISAAIMSDAAAATEAALGSGSALTTPARWLLDCAQRVPDYTADYGGEWTGFVELLAFFRDVGRLHATHGIDFSAFEAYEKAARHSGFRVIHPEFCIVSDRPSDIHIQTRNGRGYLHNERGPAKRYRDGWAIYAVHGRRVPPAVIEAPHTMTAAQIVAERNVEVRRIMLDRFTAGRFVLELGAKVVDRHELHGTLYRAELEGDEPVCVLQVVNASPEPIGYEAGPSDLVRGGRVWKTYFLRVPPSCTSALEARAWTFDLDPGNFAPQVET